MFRTDKIVEMPLVRYFACLFWFPNNWFCLHKSRILLQFDVTNTGKTLIYHTNIFSFISSEKKSCTVQFDKSLKARYTYTHNVDSKSTNTKANIHTPIANWISRDKIYHVYKPVLAVPNILKCGKMAEFNDVIYEISICS